MKAYLLAGGNMGNRNAYLQLAALAIEKQCGRIVARSHTYETAAWGVTDQPSFYNQAFVINTLLQPEELMKTLLEIETSLGRQRVVKMGPRTVDLDVLLIDELIMESELLIVPHPHLQSRRFALTPLAEIAPDLLHPIYQKTIQQLLAECPDLLEVTRID